MGNLQSLDRDGALNKAEIDRLERRLRRLGFGRSEVARSDLRSVDGLSQNPFMERIFEMYDSDMDGLLTLADMKCMMELFSRLRDEESRFRFAFLVFDSNNDGKIDKSELMTILQLTNKRRMTPAQLSQIVDSIMARWDSTGHGSLEYDAFKQMMGSTISNLTL
ncbi:hypothetical protein Ndes2526B_g02940 [Nannochloris sp. 'desiccata']|nr:hypothetical protein KSW81_006809 [Chlorella desiccata (nom. nud.)]